MRWTRSVAVGTTLALVVAACSGDDDGDTRTADTGAPESDASTAIEVPATEIEIPATDIEVPATEIEIPATDIEVPATERSADESPAAAGGLLSVAAPDCDYGGAISSITALDERTVEFALCAPDVAFESKVASPALGIWPSEVLEAAGSRSELSAHPVGTGPYMLAERDDRTQLTLVANPDYWGAPAHAETLVFRWNDDAGQRLDELRRGVVDGIDEPDSDDFETIEDDRNLQLLQRPDTNVLYLGLNRDIAPFDDVRVRRAIARGLDRQRIVDSFFPAGSQVAPQFLPAAIFGFTAQPVWSEFDPEEARALLEEAGRPDGFEVTLTYRDVVRSYLPSPDLVAADIRDQLAQLGITVDVEEMESDSFLEAADAGELAMFLLGWQADYPDATNFLDVHFGAGASDRFGEGFEDIHDVLTEASEVPDPEIRLELYEEAAALLEEHVPMVPVANGGSVTAFRADVTNAQASPLDNEYFAVMDPDGRDTLVWMQRGAPTGLYCADENDGDSLRACAQINESLLSYEIGGTAVHSGLADDWESDADGTLWTFHLRDGVTFHDGSTLDANDVVTSYAVQWDATSPLHTGRDGAFSSFTSYFGPFLNAPQE